MDGDPIRPVDKLVENIKGVCDLTEHTNRSAWHEVLWHAKLALQALELAAPSACAYAGLKEYLAETIDVADSRYRVGV